VNGLIKIIRGEYFEVWKMVNGKPTIVREGWQ
jgi:hypothetical protein